MKKLLTILIGITITMCIVSCGNNVNSNHSDEHTPKKIYEVSFVEDTTIVLIVVTETISEIEVQGFGDWNTSLGTANFVTDSIWTISNGEITQIWSDAVTATGCNKTHFNGGNRNDKIFNIDCRSNPGQKGDLFSWRAVSELKEELCSSPWRVPTVQDFIDLDIALGGTGEGQSNFTYTGEGRYQDNAHAIKYVNLWGGTFGGKCGLGGWNDYKDYWANYWSQSESSVSFRLRSSELIVYTDYKFIFIF